SHALLLLSVGPTVRGLYGRHLVTARLDVLRPDDARFVQSRMASAATVREATFDVLRGNGLTTFFGNPGSTEVPLLAGLPDDFRFVLALHEGSAVGMATGW